MSDLLSAQLLREMEENLTESDNDDEVNFTELNVEYRIISGLRENSKLVWAPTEKNLYYKNSQSKITGCEACKCYKSGCFARLYIRENGSAFRHSNVEHSRSHGSMYTEYKMMYCFNKMKEMARSAPASTTSYQIYQEVIKE